MATRDSSTTHEGARTASSNRRGPRADRTDIAAAILDGARSVFARHGYQGATIRMIATEAGVDTKLVHYYFGTKAELFSAVIATTFETEGVKERLIKALAQEDQGWTGYLEYIITTLDDPRFGPAFISLLRSVGTHEESHAIMLRFISEQIFPQIPGSAEGESASLDLALIGSHIYGILFARYILELPKVKTATPAQIAQSATPALDAYMKAFTQRRRPR